VMTALEIIILDIFAKKNGWKNNNRHCFGLFPFISMLVRLLALVVVKLNRQHYKDLVVCDRRGQHFSVIKKSTLFDSRIY
jgi:hypothetical protein